jgi:hypothetical protein
MTPKQTTVIWLGLVLVGLNLVIHIADIKAVIFGGPAAPAAPTTQPKPNPPLAPGPLTTTPPNVQIM